MGSFFLGFDHATEVKGSLQVTCAMGVSSVGLDASKEATTSFTQRCIVDPSSTVVEPIAINGAWGDHAGIAGELKRFMDESCNVGGKKRCLFFLWETRVDLCYQMD